nr:MAG TPA_asm: Calcium-dependent calmodulin binding protein [Caudoviricetes sp.]
MSNLTSKASMFSGIPILPPFHLNRIIQSVN